MDPVRSYANRSWAILRIQFPNPLQMNKKRFLDLCARNAGQANGRAFDAWFDAIAGHYRESHRRYHTPEHVDHCLRQFDLVGGMLEEPDAVELAVWYHDAVFDTEGTDNELRSAQLFEAHASQCMAPTLVRTVHGLIMVTVHSREEPTTRDQCFMVDIDLSSFGLPWLEFLRDSVAVREESPHLSDEVFYAKQRKFLTTLLSREHFYFTAFFRERHEQRARDNVSRYLASLGRGTSHEGAGE